MPSMLERDKNVKFEDAHLVYVCTCKEYSVSLDGTYFMKYSKFTVKNYSKIIVLIVGRYRFTCWELDGNYNYYRVIDSK